MGALTQKLLDAAKDGDLEMVEEALSEGANVDVSENESISAHIHCRDIPSTLLQFNQGV